MANNTKRVNTKRFTEARKSFFHQGKANHAPCWICGMPIDYDQPPNTGDDSHNLDHFFPVSDKPELQHDPGNFRHAHKSCNILRGNKTPRLPIGQLSRQWFPTS